MLKKHLLYNVGNEFPIYYNIATQVQYVNLNLLPEGEAIVINRPNYSKKDKENESYYLNRMFIQMIKKGYEEQYIIEALYKLFGNSNELKDKELIYYIDREPMDNDKAAMSLETGKICFVNRTTETQNKYIMIAEPKLDRKRREITAEKLHQEYCANAKRMTKEENIQEFLYRYAEYIETPLLDMSKQYLKKKA